MLQRDGVPCLGYRLASSKVGQLVEALREIAASCPCTCAPAYYDRGLVAPDCLADLAGDDARRALGDLPVCLGVIAQRKKHLDDLCRAGQEWDAAAEKEPKA